MNLKNVFKHFHLVNKHRWYVFKLSVRAGIPFRGLVHDLSKYSFSEFFLSAKYFDGHRSPIHFMKCDLGYSPVWLHHKAFNKHHFEYWEDVYNGERIGVFLPYKYIVESLCDKISAGMIYDGKNWEQSEPLKYWQKYERDNIIAKNPGSVEFVDVVLSKLAQDGIKLTLNSKYLKKTYRDIQKKYDKSFK